MSCQVGPNQEPASAIPGNIGIVRSRVIIWNHDPLYGRPHQQFSYPFTEQASKEIAVKNPNLKFELDAAFLSPSFPMQDMWVATKKPTKVKTKAVSEGDQEKTVYELDFVIDPSASGRMPSQSKFRKGVVVSKDNDLYTLNGKPNSLGVANELTGKDIFAHQVWIYTGSLLKRGVPLHPSDYDVQLSESSNINSLLNSGNIGAAAGLAFTGWFLNELYSAPKWIMKNLTDNGRNIFTPMMVSKQATQNNAFPIHWTLEKLTPVWQGQDFFVTITQGEQKTNDVVDPTPQNHDDVDTNWYDYKYLLYNPKTLPLHTISSLPDGGNLFAWVDGISNEAFYIKPDKNNDNANTPDKALNTARSLYWWKYKSYILIEIAPGDPDNNYFIELVKGRNPRFLHLGYEWDNRSRVADTSNNSQDSWAFIKKCRVLSEFDAVSCDELFRKKEFSVKVRNHLGYLVIEFSGYESNLWVISRQDNDPSRFDYSKINKPVFIPPAKIIIHGGNISAAVNFSPTRYIDSGQVIFQDRQIDAYGIEDKDLWLTFAEIGIPYQYRNSTLQQKYFNDKRFYLRNAGYDIDACETDEIHRNKKVRVPVSKIFDKKYRKYGKGWVVSKYAQPGRNNLDSGFDKIEGVTGVPHRVSIFNANGENKKFVLNLKNKKFESTDFKDKVAVLDVGIRLHAGSVVLYPYNGDKIRTGDEAGIIFPIDPTAKPKKFTNFVTPVISNWSLIVLAGAKPFEGKVDQIDISDLVESINDSWSVEGFHKINHEMKIKCYIPDSNLPDNQIGEDPQVNPNLYALGQKLLALHKQYFYLTVLYWWDNGVGERDAPGNLLTREFAPGDSNLLIQMTGFAPGATLEKSVNKLYMNFSVYDYSKILEDQLIFNSPFFDAMNDTQVVYELARLCHFDDSYEVVSGVNRQPLAFLARTITDPYIAEKVKFIWNGEESYYRIYNLPGTYSTLAKPVMKFNNGDTYLNAILQIAQLATKVFYFDRWGVLRFENSPAIEAAFTSDYDPNKFIPKFEFVTTPFPINNTNSVNAKSIRRFKFDPNLHASHLVYNMVSYTRSVEDAINQIVIYSAFTDIQNQTGGFIIEGHTFFEQILDPTAEGFIGYRKPFYQSNGVFGSVESVRRALVHYARMKYPPARVSFECYGVPGLKPLDIISLDDNLFYITEISHDLVARENSWKCNISGEWLKSYTDHLFSEERGETDSGTKTETQG